jgi:pilus assembly protein Flp/PilA
MNCLVLFLRDESGATSIEYAMVASGIAIAIIGAVNRLGANVQSMWNLVSTALK